MDLPRLTSKAGHPGSAFSDTSKPQGGHASDFDELILALRYTGEKDLITLFQDLKIPYKHYRIKPPQPEPGKVYPSAEFDRFPVLIPGTEWIEQPVWRTLLSVTVSIWCTTQKAEFVVVGPPENHWVITHTEFENARRLESLFEKHSQRIIDPPVDVRNCICPKYYPHYWQTD